MELLSKKKQEVDESKAYTLEEYSKLCNQIRKNIQENQMKYAPIINQHEKVKQEYEQILPIYNQKKQTYDIAMSDQLKDHNKLKEDYLKYEADFKNAQNKYYQLSFTTRINEDFLKRYEAENAYLTKPEKRLSQGHKSYNEYYKVIMNEQENLLKELKEQQKNIKSNNEDASRQVTFLIK